jgi:15-cis-phytoene desaturase
MEGAVLSGKLAAEVVADKMAGREAKPVKEIVEQYR